MAPIERADTAPIGVSVAPTPDIRMASSLFERRPDARDEAAARDEADARDEAAAGPARGTVTAPWWLLGLAGTGLLAIGAVIATVITTMARPHPVVLAAPAPARAPAAVVVTPLPAPSPVTIEPLGSATLPATAPPVAAIVAAPVVTAPVVGAAAAGRSALAAARRVRAASPKRDKPAVAAGHPGPNRDKPAMAIEPAPLPPSSSPAAWVDPFAN